MQPADWVREHWVRGGGMNGWMNSSHSFPFFFSFLFHFFVAGALAPAAERPQLIPQRDFISMALCNNVPWGQGPAQTPAETISAQTTTAASHSSASPSIMQPTVPSCSLNVSLFTPYCTFARSLPASLLIVHSLIQTLNQPQAWQSVISLTIIQDRDLPPASSVIEVIDWIKF